jgi:subtilisin family serine protease
LPVQIARYSSRGPTLDGRAKPDLIAPTGPNAEALTGGTSAAAPHAAGAAALLLDALPQATAQEVAGQLRARAQRLPAPAVEAEVGAGVLDLAGLTNVGPLLPADVARSRLTDITPPGAPIAVYRYRGPSAYPARFLRLLLPGQRPVATYRLDFARGRFDTFVTRAPSVANSFELVTDGDLLFVTFAP